MEKYKCAKARPEMTIIESQDPLAYGSAPTQATEKKWKLDAALADAKDDFRHWDMGHVQHGRGVFGLGATTSTWEKATPNKQCLVMVE